MHKQNNNNNNNNNNKNNKNNNKSLTRKPKRNNKKSFGTTVPNQLYSLTFPRQAKVTMKYYDFITFTASAVTASDLIINMNSIYDPNFSGTGHQPQGYDQYSSFYNRYRVDALKLTWTLSYTSADSIAMCAIANNSTSSITDIRVAGESPFAINKSFSKQGKATVISHRYNLADINGVTRQVYNNDDRYDAPFGSDPTEKLMLHLVVFDIAGNAVSVQYTYQLEYEVTLFDPLQQSLS